MSTCPHIYRSPKSPFPSGRVYKIPTHTISDGIEAHAISKSTTSMCCSQVVLPYNAEEFTIYRDPLSKLLVQGFESFRNTCLSILRICSLYHSIMVFLIGHQMRLIPKWSIMVLHRDSITRNIFESVLGEQRAKFWDPTTSMKTIECLFLKDMCKDGDVEKT